MRTYTQGRILSMIKYGIFTTHMRTQLQNKLKSYDLSFLITHPLPPYLCKLHTLLTYVAHTTLLQKSHILFWRFFTFGLKRKEESEWLVRIDATLRVGVMEWRKWQFFGICGLFLAQVNVMICGTESKSELGFLNGNSFGICDWVWVGVNVAISAMS